MSEQGTEAPHIRHLSLASPAHTGCFPGRFLGGSAASWDPRDLSPHLAAAAPLAAQATAAGLPLPVRGSSANHPRLCPSAPPVCAPLPPGLCPSAPRSVRLCPPVRVSGGHLGSEFNSSTWKTKFVVFLTNGFSTSFLPQQTAVCLPATWAERPEATSTLLSAQAPRPAHGEPSGHRARPLLLPPPPSSRGRPLTPAPPGPAHPAPLTSLRPAEPQVRSMSRTRPRAKPQRLRVTPRSRPGSLSRPRPAPLPAPGATRALLSLSPGTRVASPWRVGFLLARPLQGGLPTGSPAGGRGACPRRAHVHTSVGTQWPRSKHRLEGVDAGRVR